MQKFKRLSILLFVAVFIVTSTACSSVSWAVKTNSDTLPAGIYIYYMSTVYSEAYYEHSSDSAKYMNKDDLLSQTIDGKDASDWIKEKTLKMCKNLLAVEKMFSDNGLSFTDEELSNAQSTTDSQWKQYGKLYEGFGVSKDSFHRASTMYSLMYSKLFDFYFGENGTQNISDEDLKNYFLENYVSYSYIEKDITPASHNHDHDDEEDSEEIPEGEDVSSEISEEPEDTHSDVEEDFEAEMEKAKSDIKAKFDAYLGHLNDGATMESIAETYKSEFSSDTDPLNSGVKNINIEHTHELGISEAVINALKEMDSNTSRIVETEETYYLVHKGNINDHLDKLESDKDSILEEMKSAKLEEMVDHTVEELEPEISVNEKVVNKYQPDMFKRDSSSSRKNN